MSDKIKFLKIRNVKSPSRAYEYDAGIDFYIPKFNIKFIEDLKEKNPTIWPKQNIDKDSKLDSINNNSTVTDLNAHLFKSNTTYMINITDIVFKSHTPTNIPFKFDEETCKNYFTLYPNQRINIPSGIKSRMVNPGRALIAFNKSGISTKYGLIVGACVVDYLYQGEIHISLINTSTSPVKLYEDMKIVQFVETPVYNSEICVESVYDFDRQSENVDEFYVNDRSMEFYNNMSTERGEAGFDSTQNK